MIAARLETLLRRQASHCSMAIVYFTPKVPRMRGYWPSSFVRPPEGWISPETLLWPNSPLIPASPSLCHLFPAQSPPPGPCSCRGSTTCAACAGRQLLRIKLTNIGICVNLHAGIEVSTSEQHLPEQHLHRIAKSLVRFKVPKLRPDPRLFTYW